MGNAPSTRPMLPGDDASTPGSLSSSTYSLPGLYPFSVSSSLVDEDWEDECYAVKTARLKHGMIPTLVESPKATILTEAGVKLRAPSRKPRLLADACTSSEFAPLPIQLQYLRFIFSHLDFPSLLASNAVNKQWRLAMSADSRVLVEEILGSPISIGGDSLPPMDSPPENGTSVHLSPYPEDFDAISETVPGTPTPVPPAPPVHSPREILEQEQPGSPLMEFEENSIPLNSNHISPPSAVPPTVHLKAAEEAPLSDAEDSDLDSHSGFSIQFHGEPIPPRPALALSFYKQPSGATTQHLVSVSSWHDRLSLLIPARDSWLRYASRSSLLRNTQRLNLQSDAFKLRVEGMPKEEGDIRPPLNDELRLTFERLNSTEYSNDLPQLLPLFSKFPFLTSLTLQLPLEKQFTTKGRTIMQEAFLSLSLQLKELSWTILPSNAMDILPNHKANSTSNLRDGDSSDAKTTTLASTAIHTAVEPISPTHQLPSTVEAATAAWSEEERLQAFSQAIFDTLPLLSLHTLDLTHFSTPSSYSLTPLLDLPRLQSLALRDLPVVSSHVRLVRSLHTLTTLRWSSWTDADMVLFCESPPPLLKQFEIAYGSFGLVGIKAMAKSSLRTTLQAFTLDECPLIGDAALGLIASQLRSIRRMSIRQDTASSGLVGDGLVAIATLPELETMELIGGGIPLRNVFQQFCAALRSTADEDLSRGIKELKLEAIQFGARTKSIGELPPVSVTHAFSLKHLTQVTSLQFLSVRRCGGLVSLCSYVSLLPRLKYLLLERRQADVSNGIFTPGGLSPNGSQTERGVVGSSFGSLMSLVACPRLVTLHLEYGDASILHSSSSVPTVPSLMLLEVHRLQQAMGTRGRWLQVVWRGVRIGSPTVAVGEDQLQGTMPE